MEGVRRQDTPSAVQPPTRTHTLPTPPAPGVLQVVEQGNSMAGNPRDKDVWTTAQKTV